MPERPVLIVGGGIGGLALAAMLRRRGRSCEVVERAPQWAPLGAGIVLGVNAMGVLRSAGLAEAALARGEVQRDSAITDGRGRVLLRSDLGRLEPRFGPTLGIHRAALHATLLEGCAGVPIRLGTTVEAVDDEGDAVRVRLSDGSERRAALLVGADGLRSRVRELVFGPVPLHYAGSTCWRLVAPRPPDLRRMQEMWHRGLRFGVLPIGGGRVYAFATARAPEGAPDPVEGRLERLRRRFAAFAAPVAEVLAGVDDPAAILHDDLREILRCPWHRGRVALLGDAAHAMTPNMGQGAAMALEDAAVLAELVAGAADPVEVLPAWSARRAPRVAWVQRQSRRIGRVAEARGRLACALRDAAARLVPDDATLRTVTRMAAQPI